MSHRTLSGAPLQTPLGQIHVGAQTSWGRWFAEIVAFLRPLRVKVALDFPATPSGRSSDLTVAVPGAETDHAVEAVAAPALVLAGALYWGFVSAPNVVTVRLFNLSAGVLDPPAGEFTITVRH